ncbi:DciA family protein [Aurantimonas sp. Leaf443]|uniref:DUF721 domain-containing protein n=1 Tax=Aurantimonas sp. Leaf443 TaxID=1736378 RepID=UPI0006FE9113|nr:DciA family protein [Aurantimonas sp. Leaf443]KQT88089.1 hypothetical protein ASG48_01145 [Aurantimonas sp. Leaf443]
MARPPRAPSPVADLAGTILDPILRRKAGMTVGLIAAWAEVAGARLEGVTRPEKLVWPPVRAGEEERFQPATLVVACEGASALRLSHETSELVARVNAFFGYRAVERIKIVQKPVAEIRPSRKPALGTLDKGDVARIAAMVANVEDPKLRAALSAFAEATIRRAKG